MPVATEETMSYEDMKKVMADPRYKCGECGGKLNIAWGGTYGYECNILMCSEDIEHKTMSKYDKKEAEVRQMVNKQLGKGSADLMKMNENQMLERVGQAKFPVDLKPGEGKLLAIACVTYGFDPIMHELTIFQGQPYVSIDGRYRKAQETGLLDGVESRPANTQEKKDWEIPDGDYFYRAEVYVKGASRPFVGWGRVFKKESAPGSSKQGDSTSTFRPIQSNPQRMAEKRAEAQALKKAFHIPLPSAEYIGTGLEGDGMQTEVSEVKEGALIEAESKVVEDKKETKKPAAKAKTQDVSTETEEKDETKITQADVDELEKMMEKADVGLAEVGKYCNQEKGWSIRVLTDLKRWQYDEVMAAFEKGKP